MEVTTSYRFNSKQTKIVVAQMVKDRPYTEVTTYDLKHSKVDERRKLFPTETTIQELLIQENVITKSDALKWYSGMIEYNHVTYYYEQFEGITYSVIDNKLIKNINTELNSAQEEVNLETDLFLRTESQILDEYKQLCIGTDTYYYKDDYANSIVCKYENNQITITKTDRSSRTITEKKTIDLQTKEIYTDNRNLDVPDNYQFVDAIAETLKTIPSRKTRQLFIDALTNCEYYGKHYLPENISVGDTNSPSWKIFLFSVSSLMVQYQRIDAEENLNQEYTKEIQTAYGKYNSNLLRSAKGIVRGALTAPTIPLIIPYYLIVIYALNKWGSGGK